MNVLLTGASGAIGGEVARRLAATGARLVVSGRREEPLLALAAETGAAAVPADLSVPGAAAQLAAAATTVLGEIDVVVNNAGGSLQGLAWTVGDADAARQVFEINVWSPIALVAALAEPMVKRGHGVVVNVGSMAAVSPFPHLGHYAASRAALSAMTQVLRLELGPRGVRVVEVALGPVDTPASQANRSLAGASAWLDGGPGVGPVDAAASAITNAVIAAAAGDRRGVVVHPPSLRWVHRFPALGRRYAQRTARHADLTDTQVKTV